MDQLEITYRGTIYPWQCDHMGHMNVMWYTGKFDEASWSVMTQIGFTRAFLEARKCGLAAVQQNITYKRELHAGDVITIRSGVLAVQNKAFRLFHEMRNDATQEVAAFTIVTGVYMDSVLRRACPIPQDVQEKIEQLKIDQSSFYWDDTLTPDRQTEFVG